MIAHPQPDGKTDDLLADWDAQCEAHDAAMATVEAQRPEPPQPWDDFPEAVRERETPTGFFRSALREAIEEMMMAHAGGPELLFGYE